MNSFMWFLVANAVCAAIGLLMVFTDPNPEHHDD